MMSHIVSNCGILLVQLSSTVPILQSPCKQAVMFSLSPYFVFLIQYIILIFVCRLLSKKVTLQSLIDWRGLVSSRILWSRGLVSSQLSSWWNIYTNHPNCFPNTMQALTSKAALSQSIQNWESCFFEQKPGTLYIVHFDGFDCVSSPSIWGSCLMP